MTLSFSLYSATHQGRKMPPGEAGVIVDDGNLQSQEMTGSIDEDYEYDDDGNFFEIFGQDQQTVSTTPIPTTTSTTTTVKPTTVKPTPPSTPPPPPHHQQSILDQ